MTPEIYRALAPLVTVWPGSASASTSGGGVYAINVNTAPVEVLRSLGGDSLEPLSDGEVEVFLDARTPPKFISQSDLATLLLSGVLQQKKIDQSAVGFSSDYFLLNTVTEFQGHRYSMHSILHRKNDNKKSIDVISRSFGEW
jgi:general secretion pathway protein K